MTRVVGRPLPVSLLGLVAAASAGCGAFGYPTGSVYTGTKVPHGMDLLEGSGAGKVDTKTGEACATGILGIAAFGDASLDAAKKAGGITDVHSVEFRGLSILGIYTQGCTVAHGGGGNAPPPVASGGGGGAGDADAAAALAAGAGATGSAAGSASGGGQLPKGPPAGGPGGGQSSAVGATGAPGVPSGGDGTDLIVMRNGVPQVPGAADPKIPLVRFGADQRPTKHMCFTYDPADAPPGQQAWPVYKKDFAPPSSAGFVERCPTEGVVASCDFRKHTQSPWPNDFVQYFYAGADEGMLLAQEPLCSRVMHGTWTRTAALAAAPKPPPEGPVAFGCDARKVNQTCTAWKPTGPNAMGQSLIPPAQLPAFIAQQKQACSQDPRQSVLDRCPAAGLTGRCELPSLLGTIEYTYVTDKTAQQGAQGSCRVRGGAWSAP